MNDRNPIAKRIIFAIDKDGREFEIRAALGLPYETESGDWACPVALEGLHGGLPDMYGVDSWQSLVIAIKTIHTTLSYFVEDGGKLYWDKGGEELSVAELFGEVAEVPGPGGQHLDNPVQ